MVLPSGDPNGSRLQPLTSNHGDEPCPKALLPIGNKPMIDYVLTWLEPSGITGMYQETYARCIQSDLNRGHIVSDVILACPTSHRRSIADHVRSDASASFPSLRIDLQTYGDPQDSSFGPPNFCPPKSQLRCVAVRLYTSPFSSTFECAEQVPDGVCG